MSESDAEFLEWVRDQWDGGNSPNEEDFARFFALARRGAEMQEGMVVVPRIPTAGMLICGEGVTDFVIPNCFENDHAARIKEMECAWHAMIEQWEREAALPPPPAGDA